MIAKPFLAVPLLAALWACAPAPGFVSTPGVRDITAAEAAQCTYVSDFRVKPPVYGPFAAKGVDYARNQVRADARDAGANAIIFDAAPGVTVYEVHAVAYRC